MARGETRGALAGLAEVVAVRQVIERFDIRGERVRGAASGGAGKGGGVHGSTQGEVPERAGLGALRVRGDGGYGGRVALRRGVAPEGLLGRRVHYAGASAPAAVRQHFSWGVFRAPSTPVREADRGGQVGGRAHGVGSSVSRIATRLVPRLVILSRREAFSFELPDSAPTRVGTASRSPSRRPGKRTSPTICLQCEQFRP